MPANVRDGHRESRKCFKTVHTGLHLPVQAPRHRSSGAEGWEESGGRPAGEMGAQPARAAPLRRSGGR
jgi:hypothetical protein